jgi:hypothetical protein
MLDPIFPLAGSIVRSGFSAVQPATLSIRLVSARNPADGVIVARFNVAMRRDSTLSAVRSWACTPASPSALPIELTEVVLNDAYRETALIRHTGGGGDYTLSVTGVRSSGGAPLDPAFSSVSLTIVRPGDVESAIRLFDTIWGPVGIAQRSTQRRTIDRLVANRALATAVNQQLQQRLGAGDGTAGRDGRPGLGRA